MSRMPNPVEACWVPASREAFLVAVLVESPEVDAGTLWREKHPGNRASAGILKSFCGRGNVWFAEREAEDAE